jgi:hypothetical protein
VEEVLESSQLLKCLVDFASLRDLGSFSREEALMLVLLFLVPEEE